MQTIFICLESKEARKGSLMGTPGSGITFSFVTFRNLLTDLSLITAKYPGPPESPVFCSNKDWKARGTPRLSHELSLAESQSSQLPELIIELGVAGARPLWYKKILWKAKGGGNNHSHPIIFLSIIYSTRHWWWTNIETGIQWGHTGVLEASDAVLESGDTMRQCFSCPCIPHLPLFLSLSLRLSALHSPPPPPTLAKVKSTDPTVRILSFIPCPGLTNILHPGVLTRITFILLTERNRKWILDECKANMGMVLMSVTWRSPGCPLTMTQPLSKSLAAPKIYVLLDVSQPPGSSWHLSWLASG